MRQSPPRKGSTAAYGSAPASSALLEDYVSKDQIAREFGVSERTIDRWVQTRLLPPPVKLGRLRLFHVPTIKRRLAARADPKTGLRSRR